MTISIYAPYAKERFETARQHAILHPERIVGNPSLTGLWKGCPSSGHNLKIRSRPRPRDQTKCLTLGKSLSAEIAALGQCGNAIGGAVSQGLNSHGGLAATGSDQAAAMA